MVRGTGLKLWTFNPTAINGGSTAASGTQYLCGLYPRRSMTVTSCWLALTSAATGLSAGTKWLGPSRALWYPYAKDPGDRPGHPTPTPSSSGLPCSRSSATSHDSFAIDSICDATLL